MNSNLQKLRDKLNNLLKETPISSQEVLLLSKEVDVLILEFYKEEDSSQQYSYSSVKS